MSAGEHLGEKLYAGGPHAHFQQTLLERGPSVSICCEENHATQLVALRLKAHSCAQNIYSKGTLMRLLSVGLKRLRRGF